MAENPNKRKEVKEDDYGPRKNQKKNKKSVALSLNNTNVKHQFKISASGITPGTSGVFVTCQRGHEFQCVGELYSLFDEVYMFVLTSNSSFINVYGQKPAMLKRSRRTAQMISKRQSLQRYPNLNPGRRRSHFIR